MQSTIAIDWDKYFTEEVEEKSILLINNYKILVEEKSKELSPSRLLRFENDYLNQLYNAVNYSGFDDNFFRALNDELKFNYLKNEIDPIKETLEVIENSREIWNNNVHKQNKEKISKLIDKDLVEHMVIFVSNNKLLYYLEDRLKIEELTLDENKKIIYNRPFDEKYRNPKKAILELKKANVLENSKICWRKEKSDKINLIRILISLIDLKMFRDENDLIITQKTLMTKFGVFFDIDLTKYDIDLTNGLNSSIESNLSIFEEMKERIKVRHIEKN